MGYSGRTGPMPAVPRPPERHAPPEKGDSPGKREPTETQPLAVKREPAEKWWLAGTQQPAENRRPAEKWWLAGKQELAEKRDPAETQPLPVMRGPAEKQGTAGRQGSAGTPRLPEDTRRLPEDWWDPGWQAVQSPGAVPLQPEILRPGAGAGDAPAEELPAASPPSWHQVLGNTFGLWAGRHLRWLRGAPGQGRGRLLAATALAAGLVAVGIGAGGLVTARVSAVPAVRVARPAPIAPPTERTAPAGQTVAGRAAGAPAVGAAAAGQAAQVARPVWVSVPAIGIKKTKLIHLGLTKRGALQVPHSTTVAGWFTGGPRPGAVGSAVIAGHVDSKTGPGIFFWLRALKPGDKIYVGRADGTMAVFRVTRVHRYAKDKFPTNAVYGAVPDPELRLITCGGIFDRSLGSYLSNVVVFARLAG
jgi:hypothetical protein